MLTLFWTVLWAGLAALVVAAAVSVHVRKREAIASTVPIVDDEAIRQILETGELEGGEPAEGFDYLVSSDGPLDLDEIDDEEERFWSESWDEPTEW